MVSSKLSIFLELSFLILKTILWWNIESPVLKKMETHQRNKQKSSKWLSHKPILKVIKSYYLKI